MRKKLNEKNDGVGGVMQYSQADNLTSVRLLWYLPGNYIPVRLVFALPDSPVQLVQPCTSSDYKVNVSSAERVLRVGDFDQAVIHMCANLGWSSCGELDCYLPLSGLFWLLLCSRCGLVVLPFLGTAWGSTRPGWFMIPESLRNND